MIIYLKYILKKIKPLWTGASKNRIRSTRATGIAIIFIKMLEVNFVNSILKNSKWEEISEGIAKKS